MSNSYNACTTLKVNDKEYKIYSLKALDGSSNVSKLPYSLKILLENLLRHEDGDNVSKEDIEALINWVPTAEPSQEIAFTPARVLMQDFTGVPALKRQAGWCSRRRRAIQLSATRSKRRAFRTASRSSGGSGPPRFPSMGTLPLAAALQMRWAGSTTFRPMTRSIRFDTSFTQTMTATS